MISAQRKWLGVLRPQGTKSDCIGSSRAACGNPGGHALLSGMIPGHRGVQPHMHAYTHTAMTCMRSTISSCSLQEVAWLACRGDALPSLTGRAG